MSRGVEEQGREDFEYRISDVGFERSEGGREAPMDLDLRGVYPVFRGFDKQ